MACQELTITPIGRPMTLKEIERAAARQRNAKIAADARELISRSQSLKKGGRKAPSRNQHADYRRRAIMAEKPLVSKSRLKGPLVDRFEGIEALVCTRLNVSRQQLRSSSKLERVVAARYAILYWAARFLGMPNQAISQALNINYTTTKQGIYRFITRREADGKSRRRPDNNRRVPRYTYRAEDPRVCQECGSEEIHRYAWRKGDGVPVDYMHCEACDVRFQMIRR